jgi:hypothetical protein
VCAHKSCRVKHMFAEVLGCIGVCKASPVSSLLLVSFMCVLRLVFVSLLGTLMSLSLWLLSMVCDLPGDSLAFSRMLLVVK